MIITSSTKQDTSQDGEDFTKVNKNFYENLVDTLKTEWFILTLD